MNIEREKFIKILQKTKEEILRSYSLEKLRDLTEKRFEKLVADTLRIYFRGEVIHKEGGHAFPDIQCGKFGVEVKTTISDKWSSMGNSIMEGTRAQGIAEIFVLFLKKGGTPEIRIREYDKVINDIKVTHSPRYSIDMELEEGKSIFSEMQISYDDFRKDKHKISMLKNYYRKKGAQTWWIDKSTGESVTSMGVIPYDTLSKEKKHHYMIELYALYPEILESDYSGPSIYLVTKYGIHDKSFRDKFSAGGTEEIYFKGHSEKVSKNISKLLGMIQDVVKFLRENSTFIQEEWGVENKDIVNFWFDRCEKSLSKKNNLYKPSFSIYDYYKQQTNGLLL